MAGVAPRSILVVEELAHWDNGHFPVRCAQLATAYAELGYRVELLTSEGWSRDGQAPQPPFTIRCYRPFARRFRRWAGTGDRRFAHQLLTVVLAVEARAAARRMVPEPEAVIVLAWDADPDVLAATAGPGRWLVHQFRGPVRRPLRMLTIGRWFEARRRARGGCVRLAVDNEHRRAVWHGVVSYLDPVTIPVAGTREIAPAPDARVRLGLVAAGRVALLFGEPVLKQRDIVLDAFDTLDDWTLAVGGPVADGIEPGPRRHPFPGVVTDETRDLLFSAADLVVLSFPPAYRNNSGTLMDAISVGVPVVCSDDAAAAEIVKRHRLGTTFTKGDAVALAEAVRQTPATIAAADLTGARRELSNRAVARRQLLVLGILPPPS